MNDPITLVMLNVWLEGVGPDAPIRVSIGEVTYGPILENPLPAFVPQPPVLRREDPSPRVDWRKEGF